MGHRAETIAEAVRAVSGARIGVLVGTPGFGDLVTEVPFYRTLRKEFPNATLYWIGEILKPWRKFFEIYLPEAVVYPYQLSNRPGVVLRNLRAAREARKMNWTLLLDTQRYFMHSLVLKRYRAKWTVGYSSGGLFSDIKMTDPKRTDPTVLGNLLSLLHAIGIPEERLERVVQLEPGAEAEKLSEKLLGRSRESKAVGLAPWGTQETKRWPLKHWTVLGNRLVKEGVQVFWFAGPAEREVLEECVREVPGSRAPILEEAALEEITNAMGLLKRMSAVIANNNGITHLASALGVPVVIIFGPTRPHRHKPSGVGPLRILDRAEPCSPCRFTRVNHCPYDHRCMRGITPDQALDEVRTWLKG